MLLPRILLDNPVLFSPPCPPLSPLGPSLVPTQCMARGEIHQPMIQMHTGQAFRRSRYRQALCRLPELIDLCYPQEWHTAGTSVHAKKVHVATCSGLFASACRYLPTTSIDVRVALADGCGVRRAADTFCDHLYIEKKVFHICHTAVLSIFLPFSPAKVSPRLTKGRGLLSRTTSPRVPQHFCYCGFW